MPKKHLIQVLHRDRSEDIITPVVERLRKSSTLRVQESSPEFGIYPHAELVVAPFDRPEMVMAAVRAFYQHKPIAQIHAGDLSMEGSFDDIGRHVITMLASIHFCVGQKAFRRACKLLSLIGKSTEHVYKIDSISLDDLVVDTRLVPKVATHLSCVYDLVVYNSPTRRLDLVSDELEDIIGMLNKDTVWILPSGSSVGDTKIHRLVHQFVHLNTHIIDVYSTVPRPQFLGLMQNCNRFIGNSSSMFYEAPYFLKKSQIIHVGVRNTGREYVKLKPGGSSQVVKILEDYFKETKE